MKLIGREAATLSGVAGHRGASFVLGRGRETQEVVGAYVTGNFFQVLGVNPFLGRLLLPGDEVESGGNAVAVLSHDLWVGRYGGEPSVVGEVVQIGAHPYEIVGVAPPEFTGPDATGTAPAIWLPITQVQAWGGAALFQEWGSSWIDVVGRMTEGVSFEEARASMDVVSTRLREADSINRDMEVLLAEGIGLDPQARREAKQLSLILFFIVGVVLLLACTNVANLFLTRATVRRSEVGVRMALGAVRTRLVRQLVTESLLLAALATLLAAPLVALADDFIPLVFPEALAVSLDADLRVFAFLIVVGLAAGVLFGVAPSWSASRQGVVAALREGASTGGRGRTRLRDILVIAQLGLSLGLVAGAALLGRSVMNAASAQPGFRPGGLTAAFVNLAQTGRYDEATGRETWIRLVDAVSQIPGTRMVTLANQAPIAGGHSRSTVRPPGREDGYEAEYVIVGPDYFQTMGIPVVRGRGLAGLADEQESVVVVNQALANLFWPGEDAIGQVLERGDRTWRVVGIAGDVQMRSLRSAPRPGVYYPLSQEYNAGMVLHALGEPGRGLTAASIRDAVATVDPELPVSSVVDLQDALTVSMGETRTVGYLVGAFALLALVLAAVGLYGLVSYGASQRVREMGIRIALGAEPGSVARLLLSRGMVISALGVAAGLGVSYAIGQALSGLLFGVAPTDGATLGVAALLLLATAGLAAWFPAWRASQMDAAVSLRQE
jgi:predicted permease